MSGPTMYDFDAAARRMWPGWEEIRTHFDAHREQFVVQLRVGTATLDAYRAEASTLFGKLLTDGQLNTLARRIEINRRARGLRRYGRKRRK